MAAIPMRLTCPDCGQLHVDEGEFATRPHHTHACQTCGNVWRPAVVHTVGVRFLPGFKDSSGSPPVPTPQGNATTPEAAPGNVSQVPRLDAPREEPGEADRDFLEVEEVRFLRKELRRRDLDIERIRAISRADRDRVCDVVLAARQLGQLSGPTDTALADARARLASALEEYDDYIPF